MTATIKKLWFLKDKSASTKYITVHGLIAESSTYGTYDITGYKEDSGSYPWSEFTKEDYRIYKNISTYIPYGLTCIYGSGICLEANKVTGTGWDNNTLDGFLKGSLQIVDQSSVQHDWKLGIAYDISTTTPGSITNLTITPSDTTASVQFTAPSNSIVAFYRVVLYNSSSVVIEDVYLANVIFYIQNLTAGTTYYIEVIAYSPSLVNSSTVFDSFTTTSPTTAPPTTAPPTTAPPTTAPPTPDCPTNLTQEHLTTALRYTDWYDVPNTPYSLYQGKIDCGTTGLLLANAIISVYKDNRATHIGSAVVTMSDSHKTFDTNKICVSIDTYDCASGNPESRLNDIYWRVNTLPNQFNVTVTDIASEGIYIYCYKIEDILGVKLPCFIGYCPVEKVTDRYIEPPVPTDKVLVFSPKSDEGGLTVGENYAFVAVSTILGIPLVPFVLPGYSFFTLSGVTDLTIKGYGTPMPWESLLCSIFSIDTKDCADVVRAFGRDLIYSADSWNVLINGKHLNGIPATPGFWDYVGVTLDVLPFVGWGKKIAVGLKSLNISIPGVELAGIALNNSSFGQLYRKYRLTEFVSTLSSSQLAYIKQLVSTKDYTTLETFLRDITPAPIISEIYTSLKSELSKIIPADKVDDVITYSMNWGAFKSKWAKNKKLYDLIHYNTNFTDDIAKDLYDDMIKFPGEACEYFRWYWGPNLDKFVSDLEGTTSIQRKVKEFITQIYYIGQSGINKLDNKLGGYPSNPAYPPTDPDEIAILNRLNDLIGKFSDLADVIDDISESAVHNSVTSTTIFHSNFDDIFSAANQVAFDEMEKVAVSIVKAPNIKNEVSEYLITKLKDYDTVFSSISSDIPPNYFDRIAYESKLASAKDVNAPVEAELKVLAASYKVSEWSYKYAGILLKYLKSTDPIDNEISVTIGQIFKKAKFSNGSQEILDMIWQFRNSDGDFQSLINKLANSGNAAKIRLSYLLDCANRIDLLDSIDNLPVYTDYISNRNSAVNFLAELTDPAVSDVADTIPKIIVPAIRDLSSTAAELKTSNSYCTAVIKEFLETIKSVDYAQRIRTIAEYLAQQIRKIAVYIRSKVYNYPQLYPNGVPGYQFPSKNTFLLLIKGYISYVGLSSFVIWSYKEMLIDIPSFNLYILSKQQDFDINQARSDLARFKEVILDSSEYLLTLAYLNPLFHSTIPIYIANIEQTHDMYADIFGVPLTKFDKNTKQISESVTATVKSIIDGDTVKIRIKRPNIPESTATMGTYTVLSIVYADTSSQIEGGVTGFMEGDQELNVRLLGVNAPENEKYKYLCDSTPMPFLVRRLLAGSVYCVNEEKWSVVESEYLKSTRFLAKILPVGQIATFLSDHTDQFDGYGRLLAVPIYNSLNICRNTLQNGSTVVFFFKTNKQVDTTQFTAAESIAKDANIGVWKYKNGFGNIYCISDPIGAEIWLDNELTNQHTSDTLEGVPAGTHVVKYKRTIDNIEKQCSKIVIVVKDGSVTANCSLIADSLPRSSFTFTPLKPSTENVVQFDSSSSTAGSGASITSYSWKDGTTEFSTGANPFKKFTAGDHTISLKITNSRNETDISSQVLTVTGEAPPTTAPPLPPGSVTLKAYDPGGSILACNIYVDNIDRGTTPNTVSGLAPGSHVVRLEKTGYTGCKYCQGNSCIRPTDPEYPCSFSINIISGSNVVYETTMVTTAPPTTAPPTTAPPTTAPPTTAPPTTVPPGPTFPVEFIISPVGATIIEVTTSSSYVHVEPFSDFPLPSGVTALAVKEKPVKEKPVKFKGNMLERIAYQLELENKARKSCGCKKKDKT